MVCKKYLKKTIFLAYNLVIGDNSKTKESKIPVIFCWLFSPTFLKLILNQLGAIANLFYRSCKQN